MIEIIQKNPQITIIAILALIIAFTIIALFSKKPIIIKLGSGRSLSIGKKELSNDEKTKIEQLTKYRVKTVMQMRFDLLFRQIKYAENAMEKVLAKVCDDYAQLLEQYTKSKNINVDIKCDYSFIIYKFKVEQFIHDHLIMGLKAVYKENHIAEKSELEWMAHKNHIIETIKLDLIKYVDEEFMACHGISREAVRNFHLEHWAYIADVVRECLDNARIMALDNAVKIDAVKKQSNEQLQKELLSI